MNEQSDGKSAGKVPIWRKTRTSRANEKVEQLLETYWQADQAFLKTQ